MTLFLVECLRGAVSSEAAKPAEIIELEQWPKAIEAAVGCRSLNRDESSFIDNNPNAKDYRSQLCFSFEGFLDEANEPSVDSIVERKPKKPR